MECSDNPSDILSCSFFAADAAHLHGTGLDRACHSAVQVYFDGADLRQFQIDADDPFFVCRTLFCLQFPARSIRVTERIVPIAPLKSWIAWVLSVLHAPKEVVKGVFEP